MHRTFSLVIASLVLLASSPFTRAADHEVDPVHSFANFRIKHLNVGYVYGRFNGPTGKFTYDPAKPDASTFEVTLNVDAIDTANEKRDAHLKSPDFFDAKQFPAITFKSTSVKAKNASPQASVEKALKVTGDLTIHGVTKSITTNVSVIGSGKGMGDETRTGIEVAFQLNRSDYGMTNLIPAAGDEVLVVVALEGIQK
ncbi:MAG: YceI family protein [Tepidisphaeraceae bacterium]